MKDYFSSGQIQELGASRQSHGVALRLGCAAVLCTLAAAPAMGQISKVSIEREPIEIVRPDPGINLPPPGAAPPVAPPPVVNTPSISPVGAVPGAGPSTVAPPPTALVAVPPPPTPTPVAVLQPTPDPGKNVDPGHPKGTMPGIGPTPPAVSPPAPLPPVVEAPAPLPSAGRVMVTAPAPPPQGIGPAQPQALVAPPTTPPGSGRIPIEIGKPGSETGRGDHPQGRPPQGTAKPIDDGTGITPVGTQLLVPPRGELVNVTAGDAPTAQTSAALASKQALGEVLPSRQELSASMQWQGGADTQRGAVNTASSARPSPVATACVPVTFRPDPARAQMTVVDMTGDGLIAFAVENAHINAVFARAGYQPISVTEPVRWCIAQSAARELLGTSPAPSNQLASFLVQVGQAWRLMSQEQWLSYQAALQPAPQPVVAPVSVSVPSITTPRKHAVRATAPRPIAARASSSGLSKLPLPSLR